MPTSHVTWPATLRARTARWAAVLIASLWLAACGGGSDSSAVDTGSASGAATLGAEGGSVMGPGGATVQVPPGALAEPVTIRMAKDATDMPALPAHVGAVGDVFTLTPHGRRFAEPVRVSLPLPARALAAGEQLRIAKLSPGGGWQLLSPEITDRDLVVSVQEFSYFVPVVERYPIQELRLPPFSVRLASLSCSTGDCTAVTEDSTQVVLDLDTNQGLFPLACTAPKLVVDVFGGDVLAGRPPVTAVDPLVQPLTAGQTRYRFRFNVNAVSATAPVTGVRLATAAAIAASLRCDGPPASDTQMLSLPLVFPSKSGSAPEYGFSASLETPTCNGGNCVFLTGAQSVRTVVRVPSRALLPPTCQAASRPRVVLQRPDGAAYAQAYIFYTNDLTGRYTQALEQVLTFTVQPPVQPGTLIIPARLVCDTTSYPASSIGLHFATPQQATLPGFGTQPRSMAVRVGQTASFTAVASGFPSPALQWMSRASAVDTWEPVTGAAAGTLTTAATTLADNGRQFKLVATNPLGSSESQEVTLTVNSDEQPPVIGTQPAPLTILTGSDAAFAVAASGTGVLSYQWRFEGQPITAANAPVLRLTGAAAAQAGRYSVVVSNAAGSVESDAAVLTVSPVPPTVQAPTILAQPAFVYLTEGQSSALVVATTGTAPLRFQWYRAELTALNDYTPIAGATSPMLSFNPVQLGDNAIYRVEVSNAAGTVRSTGIWGSVTANADRVVPSVTQQPAPLVVLPGDTAVFAVGYSGGGRTLAFQWLKNGTAIAGATQAFLQIDNAQAEDAASYSVRISTSAGSVTSAPALLTVVGAPAITAQPQAVTGTEGASVRFAVAAGGSALRYQWTRNHVAIVGATAAEYTTPALALADDGSLYGVVVYNGAGIAFSEQALLTVRPAPVASPEDKIAAGLNHTCAIDRSDALYCWGNGAGGELGDGGGVYRDVPTRVSVLGTVKAVAAGNWDTCAIDSSDALWCWGSMGDRVPVQQSAAGVRVRAVGLGADHGCYVDDAGQVFCWGNTTFGKRGDLNPPEGPNPVRRADGSLLRDAVAVAVGVNHSCAQLADGAVWCWGADVAFGVHDTATRVMRRLPDGSRMDFTATGRVVAGRYHTCALESSSGQPMCWGHNEQGQLGDGTTISRDDAMPADIFGGLSLAAGATHTCVIRSSDMYCWGYGFMGNGGEREQLLLPVAAGRVGAYFNSADPPRVAAAGERHTCALRTSGTVQCWGWNNAGQVGNGTFSGTVNVLVPTSTTLGAEFWVP